MAGKKEAVKKTVAYIESRLDEDLKLDDIAKHAGYSKYHLNRVFAETVGCTIHKYIKRRRLTEAAKRLAYTEESIAEIAFAAGYDSQQAFTPAFRQVYTCTPQVYRQQGTHHPVQEQFQMLYRRDGSMWGCAA